jgi:hypothetical protein
MQRIFILLLLLISWQAYSQRDLKISIEDFNKDGVIDTLKSFYEGGSGFGGRYVQLINGKNDELFELTNDGCFCEIKRTILIPPALSNPENKLFLEAIKNQLLPAKRNSPDASLDWIIKSSFSKVELDDNALFDLILDPKTTWINDEFEFPSNYYLELEGDSLSNLYTAYHEAPDWYDTATNKGFLVYYSHNHYRKQSGDSIVRADSNSHYKTFHTSHGVVVKKGDLYKWLFVSDFNLTGAPEKLRWESIKMLKLVDNYLIVLQDIPPASVQQLFVINIETGKTGRLKFEFYLSNNLDDDELSTYSIENDSLLMKMDGKQIRYKWTDIFKELEKR